MPVSKPTPGATGWNVAVDAVIDIANAVEDLPTRVDALEAGGGDVTEAELAAGLATKAATVHNHAEFITQDNGDNRYILQTNAGTFAPAEATTTALAGKQPLDADLTAIAGLDSTAAGTVASDGSGWVKKTYAQMKTALGLGNVDNTSDANKPISAATQTALNAKATTATLATIATSGKLADTTDLTVTGATPGDVLTFTQAGASPTFGAALGQPAPDVIVVGATETGVLAAVAAARNGMNVLMISDSERIGGVTGYALTQTDLLTGRSPGMISGLARELGSKVSSQTYTAIFNRWHRLGGNGKPSWWLRAMVELMAGLPIRVVYNSQVESVTKTGTKITSAVIGGRTYTAPVWIDATPTGDLLQKAVTSKSIGREGTTMFGETGAEIGIRTPFTLNVDPYVTPGNAASGLIYGIDPGAPGTVGAGDGRVMLFSWRLFLTSVAEEKQAWPTPNMATYSAAKYELIARIWADGPAFYDDAELALTRTFMPYDINEGGAGTAADPFKYIDLNCRLYPTGYPNAAESLEYVTATATRRAEIVENARQYMLGLFHFILNSGDSRVPPNLKLWVQKYGPSNRELQGYGGMSPQFYAREGCRVIGDFVLTRDNATVTNGYTDWIAWGAYNHDAKDVRVLNVGGVAHAEGSFENQSTATTAGFPIPYRVLLPKAAECTNLLCPGQPSVSRYVHTAVRAIPVLMSLGEAAGYAASLAVRNKQTVQAVDTVRVQQLQDLRKVRGSIVIAIGDGGGTRSESGTGAAFATVTGADVRWGAGYTVRSVPAGTDRKAKYQPNIFRAGPYKVFLMYPPAASTDPLARATNVPVTISHVDGTVVRTINQQYPGGSSGFWDYLGEFFLAAGTPSASYVEISAVGTNGVVVDAAVKFVPAD